MTPADSNLVAATLTLAGLIFGLLVFFAVRALLQLAMLAAVVRQQSQAMHTALMATLSECIVRLQAPIAPLKVEVQAPLTLNAAAPVVNVAAPVSPVAAPAASVAAAVVTESALPTHLTLIPPKAKEPLSEERLREIADEAVFLAEHEALTSLKGPDGTKGAMTRHDKHRVALEQIEQSAVNEDALVTQPERVRFARALELALVNMKRSA